MIVGRSVMLLMLVTVVVLLSLMVLVVLLLMMLLLRLVVVLLMLTLMMVVVMVVRSRLLVRRVPSRDVRFGSSVAHVHRRSCSKREKRHSSMSYKTWIESIKKLPLMM